MAMIHEQLYQNDDMSSIDLAEYARDLVVQLFSSYSPSSLITYRLAVAPTNLTIEQSIPCGLILNELITNALKYAYPEGQGEIVIRVFTKGERVWMIVSDEGVGMPSEFNLKSSNSLGMNIIDVLTTQLDGQLKIGAPPGASFSVDFPRRPIIASPGTLAHS
jgi:two-component sensor histidine kinase